MGKQALVAAAAAALLAGCGGGTHDAQPEPSPADVAASANRICASATTRAGRVARLRGLGPPRGAGDLYLRWMSAEKDALRIATAMADPKATFDQDPRIALAIAEGKIAGYARRLSAGVCATTAGVTMRS